MTDVRDELRGVARTLRRLAEWDQEDGLIGYPSSSPARLAELVAQIPRVPSAPVASDDGASTEAAPGPTEEVAVSRVHVVADGPGRATLAFVGAMPGPAEPSDGRPFGGAAGELLDKMIGAMGLRRQNVVLLTVTLGNADGGAPHSESALATAVTAELERVSPAVVVALGDELARALTGESAPLQAMRGHFHLVVLPSGHPIDVMPTLPPAHLLENPGDKRGVWEDLRRVMGALGLPGGVPRESAS